MVRGSSFAAAQDRTVRYVLFEEDRKNGFVDVDDMKDDKLSMTLTTPVKL